MKTRGTKNIFAGLMDRRIQIQHAQVVRNDVNEEVETWVTDYTVWCEVVQMKVDEMFVSSEERTFRTTIFRIRYRASVTEAMRVIYEGKTYKITGITEIGRRDGLELQGELLE